MRSRFTRLLLVLSAVLLFGGALQAQNVLVWDNDNGSDYSDPDNGVTRSCEYGIVQALSANNINYTTLSYLPSYLDNYDIIFVVLGVYCRS